MVLLIMTKEIFSNLDYFKNGTIFFWENYLFGYYNRLLQFIGLVPFWKCYFLIKYLMKNMFGLFLNFGGHIYSHKLLMQMTLFFYFYYFHLDFV